MHDLLLVALAGFLASLVDGALGMGFGPTSSTILLASGLSPASASATVNLAKTVTGVAGAGAHWRFGNVDRRLVLRLAAPGVVGAIVGAAVVTRVDGDALRPVLATLLLAVGLRILVRFSRRARVRPLESGSGAGTNAEETGSGEPVPREPGPREPGPHQPGVADRGVSIAGGLGGLTNGLIGAWGPVVTPYLLQRGVRPNRAIGSVNTAEVAVAAAAAASLLVALATGAEGGLDVGPLVAMLAGGVVAAPVAAWTAQHVPAAALGRAVGALLVLTQTRELALAGWIPATAPTAVAGALALAFLVMALGVRGRPQAAAGHRAVVPQVSGTPTSRGPRPARRPPRANARDEHPRV